MADYSETFICNNGKSVTIEINEFEYAASVFDIKHQEVGRIEFSEEDGGLKVIWMYLDRLSKEYTRQGIGRRCFQIIRERYGLPILAEEDDGHRKDDGSHLTGDAPGFVAKMRDEGLIVPNSEPEWHD